MVSEAISRFTRSKTVEPFQSQQPAAVVTAEPEQIEVPAFGAKLGNLTQFGDVWMDLSNVDAINFDPQDGCGAEVDLRSGNCVHFNDESGAALSAYMQMACNREGERA